MTESLTWWPYLSLVSLVFFLAFPAVVAAKAPEAPPPLAKDDIFYPYLKEVPQVTTVLREEVRDGVRVTELRFSSFEGSQEGQVNPSEVYAVLARPAGTAPGQRPAMLICHGGGGTASDGGPIAWAKLGYVALAPDLPGYGANDKMKSLGRVTKMPFGTGGFDVTPSPHASVLFDAVVAGLRAFNLLGAQKDVDPSKMAMTGISWGGYMTTMLGGLLDVRVRAVFNLYGSGSYQEASIGAGALEKMADKDRQVWIAHFDAATRLRRMRATYLMYAATNDIFFQPPAIMTTFDAVPGSKYLCFGPNKSHWVSLPGGPVSWSSPIFTEMEPAFFAYVLDGNHPPLAELNVVKADQTGTVAFEVKNLPADAEPWVYVAWNTSKPWVERDWALLPCRNSGNGVFTCVIPKSVPECDWFGGITFTLKAGGLEQPMSLSTKIQRYNGK